MKNVDVPSILKTVIAERRSVRKFLDKPVPEGLLREVINAGRLAPSPTNSQPWYFVVLSGDDTKPLARIFSEEAQNVEVPGFQKIVFDSAEVVAKAPHVITVWNMKHYSRRLKKLANMIGDVYYKNYEIAEIASLGCAVENMWLTAESLGLGMVWLMATRIGSKKYPQEFNIKGDIIAVLPIGYPLHEAEEKRMRRKTFGKICMFYHGAS